MKQSLTVNTCLVPSLIPSRHDLKVVCHRKMTWSYSVSMYVAVLVMNIGMCDLVIFYFNFYRNF